MNNTIIIPNWLPCGPINSTNPNVPCCASGDFCLSDGLCHYTYSLKGGSGYYASGCTDKTYNDKNACPQLCDDRLRKDVVYNSSRKLWECCGADSAGDPNCGNPTDETFDVPAVNLLVTYYTAGVKAGSTSSSSSSASKTATVATTASPENSASVSTSASASASAAASSGPSTGAAIGIGVVCGMVGLSLIGALIFFLFRRRGRRVLAGKVSSDFGQDAGRGPASELDSITVTSSHVPKDEEPRELIVPMVPQELPADNVPRSTRPAIANVREDLPECLRIHHPGT